MIGSRPLWSVVVSLLIKALVVGSLQNEPSDNALSPKEKEAGWILLFDGKSLSGWQTSSRH